MRLVTFATSAGPHAGLVVDGGIVDLTARDGRAVPARAARARDRDRSPPLRRRRRRRPRRSGTAAAGSRPRARDRRRAEHAQPCRRGRSVARHRARGTRVSAALPPLTGQPGRASRRAVGSAGVAPARLRRRAGGRHRPARAIPHRGNCARRGRRLRLLQRRQRARLPVAHQPDHGGEELPAHRRVRTVAGHARRSSAARRTAPAHDGQR